MGDGMGRRNKRRNRGIGGQFHEMLSCLIPSAVLGVSDTFCSVRRISARLGSISTHWSPHAVPWPVCAPWYNMNHSPFVYNPTIIDS